MWVGIDVGGRRKGFHGAAVDENLGVQLHEFSGGTAVLDAVSWVESLRPESVAVDSPAEWAEGDRRSRSCEVDFARGRICGIRYTPNASTAAARTDSFYGWIEHGHELWEGLKARSLPVIECFPTASWTQWAGRREQRQRARWSADALRSMADRGLTGCSTARHQDARDAIAAALTARQLARQPEAIIRFGPLVVPAQRSDPLA